MAIRIGKHNEIGMVRRNDWASVGAARPGTLNHLARIEKLAEDIVPSLLATAADMAVTATSSRLPARLVDGVEANVARSTALASQTVRVRGLRARPGSGLHAGLSSTPHTTRFSSGWGTARTRP